MTSETEPVPLTPVDHLFTGEGAYPIEFVFSFRGKIDARAMKDSLDACVAKFSPVASHLVARDAHSYAFQPAGMFGWRTQTVARKPDLDDFVALKDLFTSAASVPGENLMEATLTHAGDSSYLGLSLSHCLVDGYSYFLFLTSWSKIFRGQPCVAPDHGRARLIPTVVPKASTAAEIFDATGFAYSPVRRPGKASEVRWEVRDYSKADLERLLAEASIGADQKISLNDALSAEVWRRFAREHSTAGQRLTMACAFDFRRVSPKVNALYFGNAVRGAAFVMDYDEVLHRPIGEIAAAVGSATRGVSDTMVECELACLEAHRAAVGLKSCEHFHVADPEVGFLVTNLSRLPLFDVDFGTGPAVDFRILTPAKRTAVVLPLASGLRVQIAH